MKFFFTFLEGIPGDDVEIASYDENTMINQGTSELPLPQLTFHHVHGSNIKILRNGRIARRTESFCKGLAFSSRPIQIDENVCIRFSEVVTNWSGVLRFGVTNVDPETFQGLELPKFACPDLTSKEGYWAKALPERYSVEGSILHFFVNADGELYYGINGVLKGLFLTGVDVSLPIWIIVDIYGNSSALEFIDPAEVRLRSAPRTAKNRLSSISSIKAPVSSSTNFRARPSTFPSSRYHFGVHFTPSLFHSVHGTNVSLLNNYTVAERHTGEYACGYVFTQKPLNFNEKIVIQILETENAYSGSLAFGVTSCDPVTIRTSTLPLDSDELLNRHEYWVGIKDVAAQPKVLDELSFWITRKGEVYFSKNNAPARPIIYVDTTVKLWAFFDIYGTTQKIRLLGTAKVVNPAGLKHRLPPLQNYSASLIDLSPEPSSSCAALTGIESSSTQQLYNRVSSNLPSQSLLNRRSHSETGDAFSSVPQYGASSRIPGLSTDGNSLLEALESSNALSQLTPDISSVRISSSSRSPRPMCPPPIPTRKSPARNTTTSTTSTSLERKTSAIKSSKPANNTEDIDEGEECKICMSAKVDCVIYTCGHMSMCFSCANEAWRVNGDCPICRKPITDVIKIYKS
uniref:Neuralized n=1 Tax=Syphacia muris TaxID=451379 RepID=A0A0N5B0E2_9BILA